LLTAGREATSLLAHRALIRATMRSEYISPAFRERLMLAVTAVNNCRYCSYFHAGQALKVGLASEEMRALLCGDIPGSIPSEERVALLYAQHWAEQDGNPDSQIRQHLNDAYGSEVAAQIDTVLQMIRLGNLSGNTFDYLLYRLSFGRLGEP
jgi:AhpD family alkylhydroperoxidase